MSAALNRFLAWKTTARPGDHLEYYRGFLAISAASPDVKSLRDEVVKAYLTGHYELAQVRVGVAEFSYQIIRRRERDPMPRIWYRSGRQEYFGIRPHRAAA